VELVRIGRPLHHSAGRSVRHLIYEILADVYDLVNAHYAAAASFDDLDCVRQVAVLIGRPENPTRLVHAFAYHSKDFPSSPPAGQKYTFDEARLGPGVSWADVLGDQKPRSFTDQAGWDADGGIHAAARVPFVSWCGRHAVAGTLAVDLAEPRQFDPTLMQTLGVAARKVAAVLAGSGANGVDDPPSAEADPRELAGILRRRLGANGVRIRLVGQASQAAGIAVSDGDFPRDDNGEWLLPLTVSPRDGGVHRDADAEAMGVLEAYTPDACLLRMPLVLGEHRVGELVAAWDLEAVLADPSDEATRRGRFIGQIIATWTAWSWNRCEMEVIPSDSVQSGVSITWAPGIPRPRRRIAARGRQNAPSGVDLIQAW
jgi:hypothetical protein